MRLANSAVKNYLNKQNRIKTTSGENLLIKIGGVTFCGPAISQ